MSKQHIVEQQTDWVADPQNELAKLEQGITLEQIQLSEKIGALKATAFVKKLVTVTEIKLLAEVKESKSYKGLKVIGEDGKPVTVTTFEQFCQNLGVSYEKVNQDIQNLSTFGEDFLETSQRMGLGYRDLRKLRKLPDNEREMVINGEAVKTEDRESLLDLIEEISAKQAKDKATLEKRLSDLEADTQAKDELLAKKNEKIDQLDAELTQRNQPNPNNYLLEQQEKERNALSLLHDTSNIIIAAVQKFHHDILSVAELAEIGNVGEEINNAIHFIYQRIAQTSLELGIQVDFENIVNPSWATPLAEDE